MLWFYGNERVYCLALRFLSSGDAIQAYINQESGKAIQSVNKQDILGEWLLRGVFQLAEREVLTGKK